MRQALQLHVKGLILILLGKYSVLKFDPTLYINEDFIYLILYHTFSIGEVTGLKGSWEVDRWS